MLRSAALYPYWQYKQVQRAAKRESHSAFHNMILRFDDPFWATGTPPNGWGCQCYRSQLSESQAKAQGGPSTPPTDNIINANIQKEWRYDPGREMLAPNFTRYENLRKIKYKGKSAISQIMSTYREEMTGYQLTQAEWNIYAGNLPDGKLSGKQLYADAPMMFANLRQDAANAIGEDSKLMVKDRSVIHGIRKRRNADNINISTRDLKTPPAQRRQPGGHL